MLPLKLISRVMGWITRLYLPEWLRPFIFRFYIKAFSCNAHEMYNEDLKSYRTISEFFRRKIKMELRPINKESPIVSPCDGRVLTCGKVSRGLIEQVKGITYTASSFLGVPLTAGLMKLQQQNKARFNSPHDHDDAHSYAESLLKYRGHALYYAVSSIKKRRMIRMKDFSFLGYLSCSWGLSSISFTNRMVCEMFIILTRQCMGSRGFRVGVEW